MESSVVLDLRHLRHLRLSSICAICGRRHADGKRTPYLGVALGAPERPFVAVIGGAKVSDKIEVIESMLGRVDRLLIGGAMAYTFFKALGHAGRQVAGRGRQARLRRASHDPREDAWCGNCNCPSTTSSADKMDASAATAVLKVNDAAIGDRMGLDIGPESARLYASLLADAKTVVWNGPMGVFELAPFAAGTMAVANAMAHVKGTTIIGGGDSVAAVNKSRRVRQDDAHLHRRRCVTGIPGRRDLARCCGATGSPVTVN